MNYQTSISGHLNTGENPVNCTFESEVNTCADAYLFGFNGKEKIADWDGKMGTYDFDARLYNALTGRWMSLDPLAGKYSGWSPYNFVAGNPILFIDPDGKEVAIHGKDARATVRALNKKSSMKIKMGKDGLLIARGKAKTEFDESLLRAINCRDIRVNLYTTRASHYISKDGTVHPILVGAYEGSTDNRSLMEVPKKHALNPDPMPDISVVGRVETKQYFNIEQARALEYDGSGSVGEHAGHEILESFFGGVNDPGGNHATGYDAAHKEAMGSDPDAAEFDIKIQRYTDGTNDILFENVKTGKRTTLIDGSKQKTYPDN